MGYLVAWVCWSVRGKPFLLLILLELRGPPLVCIVWNEFILFSDWNLGNVWRKDFLQPSWVQMISRGHWTGKIFFLITWGALVRNSLLEDLLSPRICREFFGRLVPMKRRFSQKLMKLLRTLKMILMRPYFDDQDIFRLGLQKFWNFW